MRRIVMTSKLSAACACMGPMYGEPYCYCEMQRQGLSMKGNKLREADNKQFEDAMKKAFEPGGYFYKEPQK